MCSSDLGSAASDGAAGVRWGQAESGLELGAAGHPDPLAAESVRGQGSDDPIEVGGE